MWFSCEGLVSIRPNDCQDVGKHKMVPVSLLAAEGRKSCLRNSHTYSPARCLFPDVDAFRQEESEAEKRLAVRERRRGRKERRSTGVLQPRAQVAHSCAPEPRSPLPLCQAETLRRRCVASLGASSCRQVSVAAEASVHVCSRSLAQACLLTPPPFSAWFLS